METYLDCQEGAERQMTVDAAIEIIAEDLADYSLKSRIPKGLAILMTVSDDVEVRVGHDQIWAEDFEATVTKMSEAQVREMALLGWFEGEDSWTHFT